MRFDGPVRMIACHAEGEVGDVVIEGIPPPPGDTLWAQSRHMAGDVALRGFLLNEPRGGANRHVNVLTPPKDPRADFGFIILEPEDAPPMSGSNSMCVVAVLLQTGLASMSEPETVLTLEAPGGLVIARARCESGHVRAVTIENRPSFADRLDAPLEVAGLSPLKVDTAFGGDSFVVVDAAALGFALTADEARDLAELGVRIADAASEQTPLRHPDLPDWRGISFCLFAGPVAHGPDGFQNRSRRVDPPRPTRSVADRHRRFGAARDRPCAKRHARRRRSGRAVADRRAFYRAHRTHDENRRSASDRAVDQRSGLGHGRTHSLAGSKRSVAGGVSPDGYLAGAVNAPLFIGPEIEPRLDWEAAVAALRAGHQRPRPQLDDRIIRANGGELLVRSAAIDGLGFGVKAVTIMPENPRRATPAPAVQGAYTLFDAETGALVALIDGAFLTKWKTIADSLLAAQSYVSAPPRRCVVIGAGPIAAAAIDGYSSVFPTIERFAVWARDPEAAYRLAAAARDRGAPAERCDDLARDVRDADIVSSATGARAPVLSGDWVRAPCFVDLIGAHAPEMREADDELIAAAQIFVDCRETAIEAIGELAIPIAAGAITRDAVLGDHYDLVAGAGASLKREIPVVFKNGGGAHLDLMIAEWFYDLCAGDRLS